VKCWFFRRINLGGLAGYTSNAMPRAEANARLLGRLLRHPRLWLEIPLFVVARALGEWRLGLRALGALLRGRLPRIHPLAVVVHHFMDADALDTAEGRERLDACVFRVPVGGDMVPMCAFKFAHGGPSIERPPARLGEHNEEILQSLGYTKADIEALRADGVI